MERVALAGGIRRLSATNTLSPFWRLLYGGARVLSRITGDRCRLYVYLLVAQRVDLGRFGRLPRQSGMEVREIDVEEALTLPVPRPKEAIAGRFSRGARCLKASRRGEFQGFVWFQPGAYEEDEVRCRFVPRPEQRAVWDFDVYVAPSARGGLAFARLWQAYCEVLSREGVEWSISRISAFNAPSVAAHGSLGAVRVGTACFLALGPVQLMLASTAPFVYCSMGGDRRPVMQVRAPYNE